MFISFERVIVILKQIVRSILFLYMVVLVQSVMEQDGNMLNT
jgi:hypothetical protein